ncbi:hypothetical protein QZM15_33020 [Burkholderia sp. AU44665]|uniref:hypothetical protein n=1 Tax=Burkholderia sp. AU44665 TaxID=3059203 RepID=UPI00265EC476|nr:hypothetical protein [Burkholderia sp. AU44665]MDN7703309.1 hypothetical protein [Burkholderia sp. AU44665]
MNMTLTDAVAIPRTLLQDLIDDVSDYAASREFRKRETAWRDDILARARALLATQQPEPRSSLTDDQRDKIERAEERLRGRGPEDAAAANGLLEVLTAHPVQPEPRDEPIAWESTTPVYTKYITDDRYQKFSPEARKWYKPYRCSACSEPNYIRDTGRSIEQVCGMPEPRDEVTDDDKLCASRYRWLSRQVVATHSRDDLNCRWEVDYVLYGESFDAAVDAARTGASHE